jgi:hypothetical protein
MHGGTTVTDQKALRPWRDIFGTSARGERIYSIRRKLYRQDYEQLFALLESLTVASGEDFAIIHFYTFARAFLDGGFVDHRSEDTASFRCIAGPKVLRLLCYRLGLRQPRRLPMEERIPSQEELETELAEQKTKRPGELGDSLKRLLSIP